MLQFFDLLEDFDLQAHNKHHLLYYQRYVFLFLLIQSVYSLLHLLLLVFDRFFWQVFLLYILLVYYFLFLIVCLKIPQQSLLYTIVSIN